MGLPDIYVPTVQTPYFVQGLFSNQKFAQLVASGIMGIDGADALLAQGGDFLNIPQVVQIPDFSRVDLTATTAGSPTRVSSNDAKAPVLRDYSMPSFTAQDIIRAGENFAALLGRTAGNKMAKSIIHNLDAALKGVIGVVTSHSVNAAAGATGACVVKDLLRAKRTLGDQFDRAKVMLIHPDVWTDILLDLVTTYKYSGSLSGTWIAEGMLSTIMGVDRIIVSQDLTAAAGATSSQGDDSYYTWIFCPDEDEISSEPVYFAYQAMPRMETFVDPRVPQTLYTYKWSLDYCLGLRGMKWNNTTPNPTLANLADASKWAAAYEDARNVGVVCIRSGGLKAS